MLQKGQDSLGEIAVSDMASNSNSAQDSLDSTLTIAVITSCQSHGTLSGQSARHPRMLLISQAAMPVRCGTR